VDANGKKEAEEVEEVKEIKEIDENKRAIWGAEE
jgi:hypothetical protein